jgi:hypothetical protein
MHKRFASMEAPQFYLPTIVRIHIDINSGGIRFIFNPLFSIKVLDCLLLLLGLIVGK